VRLFEFPGPNPTIVRTFRLLRPLPLEVRFICATYFLELNRIAYTAGREALVVRLPWQERDFGKELTHAGENVIRRQLVSGFDVECATLSEFLFLRLVAQKDAEELAGPHARIPWRELPLRKS
jgi:hypothetical protein